MDTYFCDPHSPWQKGQVEKTNAMIHKYIQKKTPLKYISDQVLETVQNKMNNTPRKILGFKTPQELFNLELSKFTSRHHNTPGAAEVFPHGGMQGGKPTKI